MEWNTLGDLLGQSLGGGLNTYGDIALQKKAQQQEFEQRKKMMLEQEAIKQQQMMAQQAQKQQQNELFGKLLSGGGEGGIDKDSLLQFAAQSGMNPQQLSQLERSYSQRDKQEFEREKFDRQQNRLQEDRELKKKIAEDRMQQQQEAPQRKAVTQQVNKSLETLPFIEKEIGYYETLKKLPENGNLRQGNWRKVLDKLGLGDFWQSPESDLAEKLISNITVSQAQGATNFGQATNDKLALIQKANPSLLQSPKGFQAAIEMNIRSKKADKAIADELQKISKESKGVYPLDAMSLALERAKPKIENLHKQQLDIATMLTLPDASQYKGKGMEDEETGTIFVSDGKNWKPVRS